MPFCLRRRATSANVTIPLISSAVSCAFSCFSSPTMRRTCLSESQPLMSRRGVDSGGRVPGSHIKTPAISSSNSPILSSLFQNCRWLRRRRQRNCPLAIESSLEESSLVSQPNFTGPTAPNEYLSPKQQYSQLETGDQMDFRSFVEAARSLTNARFLGGI